MAMPVRPTVARGGQAGFWRHAQWLLAAVCAALLLMSGCAGDRLVGIPPAEGVAGVPASSARTASDAAAASAAADLRPWDDKWRQIQANPLSVSLADHWRACEIKFRFRIYRDLFRCLDLIEARSDKNERQRRYAPVIIGWMRADAYAELGQSAEALRWAESGWQALPQQYRDGSAVYDRGANPIRSISAVAGLIGVVGVIIGDIAYHDDFEAVAVEAGGSDWSGEGHGYSVRQVGRHNPAGLDMRPQAIAMKLAAERALLHQQLGDTELARVALQDLHKWRDRAIIQKNLFELTASVLSLGPLFAIGDYADVVKDYEHLAYMAQSEATGRAVGFVTSLGLEYLGEKLTVPDSREFATSLEDASRALIYAESLARLGETDRARKALDAMLAASEIHAMGSIYWAALYERSQIALKDGRREDAIRLLRQAADAIEQVRVSIAFEAGKIGFAGKTQAVYESLVRALVDSGDWTGAFLTTERAKARALVDLLAQVHDLPPPPLASDRVRALLATASVNERDIGLPTNGGGAMSRSAVATARGELGTIAPEAASLVSVQAVPLDNISARLAPDETLLAYFRCDDRLYGFVVSGRTVSGFQTDASDLNDQVLGFLRAIQQDDRAAADLGRALYDRLIRPVESEIKGSKLTITPHEVLHYLPFSALSDGRQYLIDRYSLRIMPSASALAYLRTDKPNRPGGILALGNPDLGDPRFDLPGAEKEALAVARIVPGSRALLRGEASKTAVMELGGGFDILHFASHGVFEPDAPLTSGLLLAKGSETDGRLTVSDLYKLRFDADLVTLSACETALGKVTSGDDVVGLERGFLYAGARTIVASLWEIVDIPTETLMLSFYRNLAGSDKREALRRAQMETRKVYPAPRYWAAFELTGSAK
jgi:CHAT domain-containing protein